MTFTTHSIGPDGLMREMNVNWQDVLESNKQKTNVLETDFAQDIMVKGLVTHTVLESHAVRCIIPLRLRPDSDYDVAFVSERSLRICELSERDCDLKELARETDFRSRIVNASLLERHHQSEQLNTFPPPRIMLILENGTLVFVTVSMKQGNVEFSVTFQESTVPSLTEQPGRWLAICPQSRYLAVACSEGRFMLCELETKESPHCPVVALRHFRLQGTILEMTFLHSPTISSSMPFKAVLVLLVACKGQTQVHLYDLRDSADAGDILICNTKCWPLDSRFQIPSLLIPIKFGSAFALIYTDAILIGRGILDDRIEWELIDIVIRPPTKIHFGSRPPLWVAYTKPTRSKDFASRHDDLYLAREDGLVIFVEIEANRHGEFELREMLAGVLRCRIGRAFTRLGYPDASANDVLIVGGEGGDGAIYEMIPRVEPKFVCAVPHNAYLLDAIAIPIATRNFSDKHQENRNRIRAQRKADVVLVSVGKRPRNAVSKLRHGYEARPILEIPFAGRVTNGLWVYPGKSYIIASVGGNTLSMDMRLPFSTEITEEAEDISWLEMSKATSLFVATKDLKVQVVGADIRVKYTVSSTPTTVDEHVSQIGLGGAVSVLAIHKNMIIFAYSVDEKTRFLVVLEANDSGLKEIARFPWPSADTSPSTLVVKQMAEKDHQFLHCFITADNADFDLNTSFISFLYIFTIDLVTKRIQHTNSVPLGQYANSICTALYVHKPRTSSDMETFVLAGFRNGSLHGFKLSADLASISESYPVMNMSMGLTAVTFGLEHEEPDNLLIQCGDKLYGVKYSEELPFWYGIFPIWIRGKGHGEIVDFAVYPHGMIIHKDESLYVCSLAWQERTMPWAIIATDGRYTSGRHLACGVQLTTPATSENDTLVFCPAGSGLQFMRFHDSRFVECSKTVIGRLLTFPHPHQMSAEYDITCIEPASYDDGLHKSDLLVYGQRNGAIAGFDKAIVDRGGNGLLFDQPGNGAGAVTAIALLRSGMIVFAKSDGVHVIENRSHIRQICLPSSVVNIEIWEEGDESESESVMIEMLTSKHSLFRYRLQRKGGPMEGFLPSMDGQSRSGITSLHTSTLLEKSTSTYLDTTLVSHRPSCVTGLAYRKLHAEQQQEQQRHKSIRDDLFLLPQQPISTGDSTRCHVLFEAELHWPITRFMRALARPPWDPIWGEDLGVLENELPGVYREADSSDILGVSPNGNFTCFTIIEPEVAELLARLQLLIQSSQLLCPNTWNLPTIQLPLNSPLSRHIDGDLLKRAVGPGKLKRMIDSHDDRKATLEFLDLLTKFHGYDLRKMERFLTYLLRPVM